MANSTNLWIIFKRNISAIFQAPTTGASIFKYFYENKLVEGYIYYVNI
ncbi:MAG: hypothetical protein N4A50_08910 [Vallitalea sp.]|jgi:hypothetical protein|nr:hypothetical protein [Vallitalea sp.]